MEEERIPLDQMTSGLSFFSFITIIAYIYRMFVYVPDKLASSLHVLTYLILIITLYARCYYPLLHTRKRRHKEVKVVEAGFKSSLFSESLGFITSMLHGRL